MLKVVYEEKQAIEADGFRESSESWADLLRCKRRGMRAPVLAVGDGALGFWKALREVFPTTRGQRCWFHVSGNILAALPKSAHPGARAALAEIYNRRGPRARPQGRKGVRGALRREVAQGGRQDHEHLGAAELGAEPFVGAGAGVLVCARATPAPVPASARATPPAATMVLVRFIIGMASSVTSFDGRERRFAPGSSHLRSIAKQLATRTPGGQETPVARGQDKDPIRHRDPRAR